MNPLIKALPQLWWYLTTSMIRA